MNRLGILSILIVFSSYASIFAPMFRELPQVFSVSYIFGSPQDLGLAGGVAPMLQATVVVLSISVLVAASLGLPVAIALSRSECVWLRSALDLLAGIPSIVFGLLGHAVFVQGLGFGYSLLSGGLTLACMILPFFIRVAEDGFRLIPQSYSPLASSLGFTEASRTFRIEIPLVMPSLVTGFILSWMRAAAETAALLFTAGYSIRPIEGIGLFGSGRPLSVHVFELSMNIGGADDMAWRSAGLLMLVSFSFILLLRVSSAIRKLRQILLRAYQKEIFPKNIYLENGPKKRSSCD